MRHWHSVRKQQREAMRMTSTLVRRRRIHAPATQGGPPPAVGLPE